MQRRAFNEELDAEQVTIVGTEMEIAVSAEDGDSVYAIPVSKTLAEGSPDVDIRLNAGDYIDLRPSASVTYAGGALNGASTANICIKRIGV